MLVIVFAVVTLAAGGMLILSGFRIVGVAFVSLVLAAALIVVSLWPWRKAHMSKSLWFVGIETGWGLLGTLVFGAMVALPLVSFGGVIGATAMGFPAIPIYGHALGCIARGQLTYKGQTWTRGSDGWSFWLVAWNTALVAIVAVAISMYRGVP